MNERILLAEDNPILRADVSRYLSGNHYTVETARSGGEVISSLDNSPPDLVILDALLPGGGAEICRMIRRRSSVPIILTAEAATTADAVRALESGADDFLKKPCDLRELSARAKAVLRRSKHEFLQKENLLIFDGFELSIERYELRLRGERVDLTPKELQLLYFLASNCNRVFTRDQLLDKVWGFDYLGDSRTVDVHVKRLREKLEGVSDKWVLKTVWGVGYKFELLG